MKAGLSIVRAVLMGSLVLALVMPITAEKRAFASHNGTCAVNVSVNIQTDYYNESPRNNQDGTYFAGDAFDFTVDFSYGGSGVCKDPQLDVYTSGDLSISCDSYRYGGCISGHVEISTDADIEGHTLYAKGRASHRHCSLVTDVCWWHTHQDSDSYTARVVDPELDVNLVIINMTDADGYTMRNLDGSYYLYDAIAVRHEVDYRFKNDRIGTVEPVTARGFGIAKDLEYDCKDIVCTYTVEDAALTPYTDIYDYGYGITLYNATTPEDYGNQVFDYQTKLYNIGKEFIGNSASNSANALVVKYQPRYDVYPYLILRDGDQWSYGKRIAIATHYLGSEGGEKDDAAGLHEFRRSKINNFTYKAYAFNVTTDKVDITGVDGSNLEWKESESPDDKVLENTLTGRHATFVKAGYGKFVFSYPIKDYITSTRLENVTVDSVFQSRFFAGSDTTQLFVMNYTYPAVKFGNAITVRPVDSEGDLNSMPLQIQLVPAIDEGAIYLHDYLRDKIIYDTGDARFADIVLDDAYGRANDASSTSGELTLNTNMTSLYILDLTTTIWPDKMEVPLHYALAGPTPYVITIEANGKIKTLKAALYTHYSDQEFIINMDNDNMLNATRQGKVVDIYPDRNFGAITRLTVNGTDYDMKCAFGCSINDKSAIFIEAYNEWDGRASASVPDAPTSEFESTEPPVSKGNYGPMMIALMGLLAAIAIAYIIQRWVKRMGGVFL